MIGFGTQNVERWSGRITEDLHHSRQRMHPTGRHRRGSADAVHDDATQPPSITSTLQGRHIGIDEVC